MSMLNSSSSSAVVSTSSPPQSMSDHILDLLRCVVCLEYFSTEDSDKSPRLLDCSHSFCLSCCRDISATYSRTHISMHNEDYCLPCPVCRQITYLTENGVESLRPNLTAIGLLDVPMMMNVSTKPLIKENILSLQEEITRQMVMINSNAKEIDKAMQSLALKESKELSTINAEFDWIGKLLEERRKSHLSQIESGFAVRKTVLLNKQQDLQRILSSLREALDSSNALLADDAIHPQALVDKKQSMRRLLRESSSSAPVAAAVAASRMKITFLPSFFNRVCQGAMLFGNVYDTTDAASMTTHFLSLVLERFSSVWDLRSDLLMLTIQPSLVTALTSAQKCSHMCFITVRRCMQGAALFTGISPETLYSSVTSTVDISRHLVRTYVYFPSVTAWRAMHSRVEVTMLVKLTNLLADNSSVLYHDNPVADLVVASLGASCRLLGIAAPRVRAIGFEVELLRKMGFSAKSLRDAGFDDILLMRDLGYSVRDLVDAGYGFEQLSAAGCGFVDIILAHGFDV